MANVKDKTTLQEIEDDYIAQRIDSKEYIERRKKYLFQDKKKRRNDGRILQYQHSVGGDAGRG